MNLDNNTLAVLVVNMVITVTLKQGLRYLTVYIQSALAAKDSSGGSDTACVLKPRQDNPTRFRLRKWRRIKRLRVPSAFDRKGRRASRGIRREEQLTSPFPLDSHIFICD